MIFSASLRQSVPEHAITILLVRDCGPKHREKQVIALNKPWI